MSSGASPAGGTTAALLVGNARYWRTVAPVVRRELRRWRSRAQAISDPARREAAVAKLVEERFNVEVAATQATLVRPRRRGEVTRAVVALQVAYDYLDLLTEAPARAPDAERLLCGLRSAFDSEATGGEDRYLTDLQSVVRETLDGLPAAASVREAAVRTAALCARAQALRHAAELSPPGSAAERELWSWARVEGSARRLEPFELVAGASGAVLCLHALIVAAADSRTDAGAAARIERVYLLISVLSVLDSVLDARRDARAQSGLHLSGLLAPSELAERLTAVAIRAAEEARALPHAAHHRLTLAGVVAYYASDPGADDPAARATFAQLRAALGPALTPTLLTMRAWRAGRSQRPVSWELGGRPHRHDAQGVGEGGDARPAGTGLSTSAEGGC